MSTFDSPEGVLPAVAPILDAYRNGHQTLLVSGRSLFDLHINERGELRPLRHTLMRLAKEQFGMATLAYNLALGPRWTWEGFDSGERKQFEHQLASSGSPLHQDLRSGDDAGLAPHERAYHLLRALYRTVELAPEIPPILVLLEFAEDLAPDEERGGGNDWIMQINQLLVLLGSDYLRRRQRLLVVVTGTPERMDRRVVSSLRPIHLAQPEPEEKRQFITVLRTLPHLEGARYEKGLDDQAVANLTARTPNQSLEEACMESARSKRPISHAQIVERKRADVVSLSEGTLELLDTERVRGVKLTGRTIERPLGLLQSWAQRLKEGDPHTPMNVMLAGAPSTAKTDLALLTAQSSQTPAYSMGSPKGPLVGQTERRVRLQFRVFKELSPAFGVIDEITEAFQMERNASNLDSGASAAVTAEMLNALSDSSRAGRTLLIATTNCPWRVGSAMASRFIFVPVLSAVEEDYPAILCAVAGSLLPDENLDPKDDAIRKAARLFYQKGASPRTMRTMVASKIATSNGQRGLALLQRAATACAPQDPRDRASSEYADLFAIRVCSDLEMLPWHGRITNYALPPYLRGIVSESDGSIDLDRLNHRIDELRPIANV